MLVVRRRFPILLWVLMALAPAFVAAQEPDVTDEPEPAPAPAPAIISAPAEMGPPMAEPPPPIYEDQLLRLSEILGGLYFLRGLCDAADADAWQSEMRALLAAERPGPQRRSRLVGRFNHGFETFNSVYRSCTPSARLSIGRYLDEGEALSNEVRSRYSQ